MWNSILGALAIVGMIILATVAIHALPNLVDAICDRIRDGVGTTDAADEEGAGAAAPTP